MSVKSMLQKPWFRGADGRRRSGRKKGQFPRKGLDIKADDFLIKVALGTAAVDPALKLQLLETLPTKECRSWQALRRMIAAALGLAGSKTVGGARFCAPPGRNVLASLARFVHAAQRRDSQFFQQVVIALSSTQVRYGKRLKDQELRADIERVGGMSACETEADFAHLVGLEFKPRPELLPVEGVHDLNRFRNRDGSTSVLASTLGFLRRTIEAVRGKDAKFFERILEILRNADSEEHPLAPTDRLVQLLTIFHVQCQRDDPACPPPRFTFLNFRHFAAPMLPGMFPNYRHVRAVAKGLGFRFLKDRPGPKPV